jgi:hypothetical protein
MNTVTVTQQHTAVTAYKPTLQTKHSTIQEALEFDLCGISQRVRLITTLFNADLWLRGATHLLQFMPTWCGQGKLLVCCCSATIHLEWR